MQISVWFKGVRGKLLLMIAIPVLLMAIIVGVSYNILATVGKDFHTMADVKILNAIEGVSMESNLNASLRFFWKAAATTAEDRESEIEDSKKSYEAMMEDYKGLVSRGISPKNKEIFDNVTLPNLKQGKAALDEAWALLEKNTAKDTDAAVNAYKRAGSTPFAKALESFKTMGVNRKESAKEEARQIEKQISYFTFMQLMGSLAGAVLLIGIGFFTARWLAKVLGEITSEISGASDQVGAASGQLSTAGQQVSSGATEAASALEETVSSIEELSSMVRNNADNAKQAASLSSAATTSAVDGAKEIKQLMESMGEINQSSKKIEEIINVIDDIAFQTNLLALNAAVEAARAGEQGKGFAVVAEAVRNLAQRSSSAAKDITTLIKESVSRIERGTKIADSSGSVLNNIVGNIKKVADLNTEIASASAEQANGISQISKAMNELDSATQQNAASAEEVAASAEEMSAQAITMQGLVEQLSFVVDGSKHMKHGYARAASPGYHVEPNKGATPQPQAARKAPAKMKPRLVAHSGGNGNGNAADIIPFGDENTPNGKVGTTDGF